MSEQPDITNHAQATGEPTEHRTWQAPVEFAVHAAVGTLCFLIIAGVAIGLNIALERLNEFKKIDAKILYGIVAAEYSLFATDLILFGIFLWRTALRTIRNL